MAGNKRLFRVKAFNVKRDRYNPSKWTAEIKIKIGKWEHCKCSEGSGPMNALENTLRDALWVDWGNQINLIDIFYPYKKIEEPISRSKIWSKFKALTILYQECIKNKNILLKSA